MQDFSTTQSLYMTQTLKSHVLEVEDSSLVIVEGPHAGVTFPIQQDIIDIGRQAELCDLVLSHDPGTSSLHARLRVKVAPNGTTQITIRDMGSRNGLYVEGVRVTEAYLGYGLRVQLGNTVFTVQTNTSNRKQFSIQYFDPSGLLVGRSPQMRRIFAMLARLGQKDVSVLLTGETGTGKTSIALALHRQSLRNSGPFVDVNCGALPPSLIESALFGHEKGAFTGATHRHIGFFEQAHGGTLFLDELGELPLELQPKLLQVLEKKSIKRLGGTQIIPVDFRLVGATHKDMNLEVKEGRFRQDLYYRLSVVPIEVPPLRERAEDIPLLIERLLSELYPESNLVVSPDAMVVLQKFLWPGNVRQLRNVLERTCIFLDANVIEVNDIELPEFNSEGEVHSPVHAEQLPVSFGSVDTVTVPVQLGEDGKTIKELMASFERTVIEKALDKTDWNVQEAARLLDMAMSWLYKRIKKYNIEKSD